MEYNMKSGKACESYIAVLQELFKSIKLGRLADVIYFVNIGANITPTGGHTESALQTAESSKLTHIAQYLKLNGAENESYSQIWSVMVCCILTIGWKYTRNLIQQPGSELANSWN